MSKRIASITTFVTASLLAGLAAFASPAEAQCRRAWGCANLQVCGGVSVRGGVYIGPMAPPPPQRPPRAPVPCPWQRRPPPLVPERASDWRLASRRPRGVEAELPMKQD